MGEDADSIGQTIRQVAQQMTLVQAQHDEHLRATKGRFNLFTVLLNEGDETRLHSRYLAYLLDPSGKHDCGSLFLTLFLEVLRKCGVQTHEDAAREKLECLKGEVCFASEKASVQPEVVVPEGRLDILIECPTWGAIAIENKIWAGEGNEQLLRYSTYLKRQYAHRAHVLLYLTLDGKTSTSAHGEKYYRISYKDHILPWLEECLRATYQHVNINQALQQYKNVVCKLVGHPTLETEYMEKMKDVVRANSDIVANWSTLSEAVGQLREEYRNKLLGELKEQLAAQGIKLCDRENSWLPLTKESSMKFPFGNITVEVCIDSFFKDGSPLINGAWTRDKDNSGLEFDAFMKAVMKSSTPEYDYNEDVAGWGGFYYQLAESKWLSVEQLAQHLKHPEDYKKIISGWVSHISKFIETVVKVCNESPGSTLK